MAEETTTSTALQPQQSRHLAPLTPGEIRLSEAEARLAPANGKDGTAMLASCLTLCAPTGMSQPERAAWLAVARQTLKGIPADLLDRGCKAARETADHPSKIVPSIIKEVKDAWANRKREVAIERGCLATLRIEHDATPAVPHDETQRILAEVAQSMKVSK